MGIFLHQESLLDWSRIHWPTPLNEGSVDELLRVWAADVRAPIVTLEVRATHGGVIYLLGVPPADSARLTGQFGDLVRGALLTPSDHDRGLVQTAGRLRLSGRLRPTRTDDPVAVTRSILSSLVAAGEPEDLLVLQVQLGPRKQPMVVPADTPKAVTASLWQVLTKGSRGNLDGETRSALRNKTSLPGFDCSIRIGVDAGSAQRRRSLLLGLLSGLRTATASGVAWRMKRQQSRHLNDATSPWIWGMCLNVQELRGILAWPIGNEALPGQPPKHPKRLRADSRIKSSGMVLAVSDSPGDEQRRLALSTRDALQHVHLLGPTGSGKSTLMTSMIVSFIEQGHGVVVIEPKDLVADVLARIPAHRQDDVVVLDPTDEAPVGLNPLQGADRNPELVADSVLAVFRSLFERSWGPRSEDILNACLRTLAMRSDASLVMLPLLLTNPGFRRSLTSSIDDPLGLGGFWNWYENISEAERNQAIAPTLNRLRAVLTRRSAKAVLGQVNPRFNVRQVFTERKILLCPLSPGKIGSETANLIGGLIVSQFWQATLERIAVAPGQRHEVGLFLDEVQNYLHLPTDLAEAFATARGYGVSITVAHQLLDQLSPNMRANILANARSRVCFRLSADDAAVMARGQSELEAEDFSSLGSYEVYLQLMANGSATKWASGRTLPPTKPCSNSTSIRATSRARYGRPLSEIEAGFAELIQGPRVAGESFGKRPRRSS